MELFFRSSSGTQSLSEAGGVLGRAEDAAIRLADDSVSSHHAEFTWDGQTWWIRPLAQHNPIYRDGKRLPMAKVPLGHGGTLLLGKLTVSFWTAGHEPKGDSAAQPEWQRLRLRDVPSDLLTTKPPLVEVDLNKSPTFIMDRQPMPATLVSAPQPYPVDAPHAQQPQSVRTPLPMTIVGTVSPLAVTPPPDLPPPVVSAEEPPATASEGAELAKQASFVIGLLTLLCLIGFGVGYWLLG